MQGYALNSYHLKEFRENITTFFLYLHPMNSSKIGCILVFLCQPMPFIYIYIYACFSQGVLLVFHNREKSLPSFSIKSLPLLHHTNEMTESTPLLKVLFLAPVDFLSPFGLIAFCRTLVILRFHFIRLWV